MVHWWYTTMKGRTMSKNPNTGRIVMTAEEAQRIALKHLQQKCNNHKVGNQDRALAQRKG